jgi:ubiquinone/menaquinone biosynthesis C-methylase UbiE
MKSIQTLSNKKNRLYDDLAWTFPIITPLEHYIEETELFCNIIRKHAKIEIRTLLHVGCGGGHNDYVFKKHFQVTGLDRSQAILRIAKKLNPEVDYICKDMRSFHLNRTYDAIVAIDSIAYLNNIQDLIRMFSAVYRHLNIGGVFMFLMEDTRDTFIQNNTTTSTNKKGKIEITFIDNRFDPDPTDTSYESTFIYLVRQRGKLKIFTDRHRCGLFDKGVFTDLLKKIGFQVQLLTYKPPKSAVESSGLEGYQKYPMFVCVKP